MIKTALRLWYFSVLLLIASCANQVAPTGGPKDIAPPKVLKSIPENFSTRFAATEIIITFNEYVQLKDLSKQLIISPPLEKTPSVTIRKKSLVIKFEEPLKANTTYTMNFGAAVADNNEGNAISNFQYVFSTGDVLDTLAVQGSVINAFDHSKEKSVLVMLYKVDADSIPYQSRPDYFNRTGDSGVFKITNIAPGDYKVFALKETNGNYLFDSREESIAFLTSTVKAGESSNIHLELFKEKDRQRIVNAYSERPGKAVLVFNLPVKSLRIVPANDSSSIALTELSLKKDTVILWYQNRELDSLNVFIDEAQMERDTLTIRLFKNTSKSLKGRGSLTSSGINSNLSEGSLADLDQPLLLTLAQPAKDIDVNLIRLTEDSLPVKNLNIQFADSSNRKLSISNLPVQSSGHAAKWKENALYTLTLPSSALHYLLEEKADSFQTSFKTKSLADYGTVALKVSVPEANRHYLLQVIDEKEAVYRQVALSSDTTIHFEYLPPRQYRLKLIEDGNNNGEWDPGNYLQHVQPEKVTYHGGVINVRANWDVEITWNLK